MSDIVDQLIARFEKHGSKHYGEDVTQLEHALQCAELARQQDGSDAMIVAALLHDIGQLIDDAGSMAERHGVDARHEILAEALLGPNFPRSVTDPIRYHVDAKRYLCAARPDYAALLSDSSRLSLRLQGGPMDEAEMQAFRALPAFAGAILLRECDDAAKRHDWIVPDLASYRPLLERICVSGG
ncbi:HD domain-containing protein [Sphingomonas sp. MMS24-J13]|uniref:HD domain-containing protein n=1 Tax=Sphingomonas sp. MMS24-J13 TaxID=3238686 RepID=UPI00384E57A4